MPYCASRNNIENANPCNNLPRSLLHVLFDCICTRKKKKKKRGKKEEQLQTDPLITPLQMSQVHRVAEAQHIHLQVAHEKDNTFSPQQNLCSLTHSLLDNKSEFAFAFHHAAIYCEKEGGVVREKRRRGGGRVGGVSVLCMSQQMKKLAEKRHLLVVTLVSPGSHRIMSRVAVADWEMAERGGGVGEKGLRGATDDCALHQMRGVVETWICDAQTDRQTRDSLKNVACKGKGGRGGESEESHPRNARCRNLDLGWCPVINTRAWPLTLAGWRKDEKMKPGLIKWHSSSCSFTLRTHIYTTSP